MVRPWKQVYDDIIVNHFNSTAVVLAYKKDYSKNEKKERSFYRTYESSNIFHIDGKPLIKLVQAPQSVTDIWRAIKNTGYPKVHRETVYAHLNRLEKKQVLVKLPKHRRRYNKTLYELSKSSLAHSLDTLPPTLYDFISELGTLRQILYALDLE